MGGIVKAITKLFGGGDDGATQALRDAQERARQSAEAARLAQENMQKNFAADLKQENVAQVVAGGTATDITDTGDFKRKKKPAGALSSSLGIV